MHRERFENCRHLSYSPGKELYRQAVQSKEGINMSEFVPWNSQPIDDWASLHSEGEIIELDGRKTHFVRRGQGSPVVLIHGFNLDWHTWMRNLDQLAADREVFAPDLWGQGLSTRLPLDYGYELFVEQIRLFMDVMGIESASLVGHSMGGGTSIVFALHNRQRVDKLVLVDSTGIPTRLPFRSTIFKLPGVAEFLLSLRTDRIRRTNLEDIWIHKGNQLSDEDFEKFVHYQKIEGTTEALLSILRKDFFNTLEEEIRGLGMLNVPTLIIWGRQDLSLPVGNAEVMHRLMPKSRLEVLEQAGHLANYDQADTFNQLVIDFLNVEAA